MKKIIIMIALFGVFYILVSNAWGLGLGLDLMGNTHKGDHFITFDGDAFLTSTGKYLKTL